jgi:hypothetical protein
MLVHNANLWSPRAHANKYQADRNDATLGIGRDAERAALEFAQTGERGTGWGRNYLGTILEQLRTRLQEPEANHGWDEKPPVVNQRLSSGEAEPLCDKTVEPRDSKVKYDASYLLDNDLEAEKGLNAPAGSVQKEHLSLSPKESKPAAVEDDVEDLIDYSDDD